MQTGGVRWFEFVFWFVGAVGVVVAVTKVYEVSGRLDRLETYFQATVGQSSGEGVAESGVAVVDVTATAVAKGERNALEARLACLELMAKGGRGAPAGC